MSNQPPPPPNSPPPSMPGVPPYGMPYQPQREHPEGTKILVLGILGLVCCSLAAPFAWVMGGRVRKEINESPGVYSNSGMVTAGWVCGIIGTVLLALSILYIVLAFGIFAASN